MKKFVLLCLALASFAAGANTLSVETQTNRYSIYYAGVKFSDKDFTNTFGGGNSGYFITSGTHNTGYGVSSLYSLSSGNYNSAFGSSAMQNVTTGFHNSAFGLLSLFNLTTGDHNVGLGSKSLYSLTTGYQNFGGGTNALLNVTVGYNNVGVGHHAGSGITTGYGNAFGGAESFMLGSGDENASWGYQGLYSATSANYNALLGSKTFRSATSLSKSVAIGFGAGYGSGGVGATTSAENQIVIGFEATASSPTKNNEITLGNSAVTDIRVPGVGLTAEKGRITIEGSSQESISIKTYTTTVSGLSGPLVTIPNAVPENCINLGVTVKITATITGPTSLNIGDLSVADKWGTPVGLGAGVSTNVQDFNIAAPVYNRLASSIILSPVGGSFTGGDLKITAHCLMLSAAL